MWTNPAHLVYIVLSPILSTIFALFNIVTIYVFYKKFRLSTLSMILIINICLCDIFVCLFSNTFYVTNILHPKYAWTTGPISCKLFKFLTMLTNIAQIYFLCFLNADRLRRLINATQKQWSKRHGIIFTTVGWILATLLCIPRIPLFDVKVIKKISIEANKTMAVNYNCKPVGLNKTANSVITSSIFVIAYALPACHVLYTLIRSQLFMWQRRKQIHICTTKNAVLKMSSKLALTFNLTAALFMVVWSPFFILSLVDLIHAMRNSAEYINTNFTLRCTLLIIGSAKPILYLICLDKFRHSFRCGMLNNKQFRAEAPTSLDRSNRAYETTTSTPQTKTGKLSTTTA